MHIDFDIFIYLCLQLDTEKMFILTSWILASIIGICSVIYIYFQAQIVDDS